VDLDVVFLGTSGSAPTAQRATSATLVRRGGDRLLIDCGEGTQRQLLRSDVGLIDLEDVFLTHFHADHYLGLPGMLKTFALRGREVPLTLYGPSGLRELLVTLRRVFGKLTYPLETVELDPGDVIGRGDYEIRPFAVDHGPQAVGYLIAEAVRPGRFDVAAADALGVPAGRERGALQRGETVVLPNGETVRPEQVLGPERPGRSLALTGDTAPAAAVVDAAAGVDLLVHEATFCADERQRAQETQHSTAGEAALAAREAGARLLALTHISSRYFGGEAADEACQLFPNTVVPRDFDTIEIPFVERGDPVLVPQGARRGRGRAAPDS
jgi:ribonuclease Z